LTSIDLTIAGHTYSLAEVGFAGATIIGSTLDGVGVVIGDENTFFLDWTASSITPVEFAYGCEAGCSRGFTTSIFTQFNVTAAAPVPEPSTFTLLLVGILGFCVSLHLVRSRTTTNLSAVA
jgi:PEP-CTERM motif